MLRVMLGVNAREAGIAGIRGFRKEHPMSVRSRTKSKISQAVTVALAAALTTAGSATAHGNNRPAGPGNSSRMSSLADTALTDGRGTATNSVTVARLTVAPARQAERATAGGQTAVASAPVTAQRSYTGQRVSFRVKTTDGLPEANAAAVTNFLAKGTSATIEDMKALYANARSNGSDAVSALRQVDAGATTTRSAYAVLKSGSKLIVVGTRRPPQGEKRQELSAVVYENSGNMATPMAATGIDFKGDRMDPSRVALSAGANPAVFTPN
jgi:hypothetical protein